MVRPVVLVGLGLNVRHRERLPKGRFIPVPFFVDVVVGEPLFGRDDHRGFISDLGAAIEALDGEISQPEWT